MPLRIAVIVPVYNSADHLRRCLASLAESLERFECIVVDDGSIDASSDVAREAGATLVSTGSRRGPGYARNLGAKATSAEVLFFIDSDVCVYPDTLGKVLAAFSSDPELSAVIGSYDDSPDCQDFISQYKNLMHCYVHQHGMRRASTFWSGCGAILQDVFVQCSGFDSGRYDRPAIEDIELGYRLLASGRKVMLDHDLTVKHLKHWTFLGLLKSDILDRGIPWTELILRDRTMPDDLNLQLSQRVSVALVFLLLGLTLVAAVQSRGYFLVPLFAIVFILLSRYWVEAAAEKRSKAAAFYLTAAMTGIVGLAWFHGMMGLVPPVLLAYALLFAQHRYAHDDRKRTKIVVSSIALYVTLAVIFVTTYLPRSILVLCFLGLVLIIVALNSQFYLFLAEKRGGLFAIAAIPLHLLYHFYNGISFAVGVIRHVFRTPRAPRSQMQQDRT